tara:strand:- start:64 stop:345 length:282 start_codon:yes stop_codon:yes gene_type:complete
MNSPYEITPQERIVGTIGRDMMDYSETASMAGLKDKEIAVFNMLSDLGYKMTQVGRSFGPTLKDFTDADHTIIAEWNNGWRPKPGRKCTRTTF